MGVLWNIDNTVEFDVLTKFIFSNMIVEIEFIHDTGKFAKCTFLLSMTREICNTYFYCMM